MLSAFPFLHFQVQVGHLTRLSREDFGGGSVNKPPPHHACPAATTRCTVMPAQREALKIGTEGRLNLCHLTGAILLATAVGALASWLAIPTCHYHYGAAMAHA